MSLATMLLSQLRKAGDSKTALALLSEMKESGTVPDVISYNATISACIKAGDSNKANILLLEAIKQGLYKRDIDR